MKTIDFHSHILPKCDHGSDGRKTSAEQLLLAKEAGVDVICATSHFYPHRENVDRFLQRREISYNKLLTVADASAPKILLGAEILACNGIERMPDLEKLCLGDTNILLIEMPFCDWPDGIEESVINLARADKFKVVLAHVERYDKNDIQRLIDYGISAQVNADCLCGLRVKSHIEKWIESGAVVAVGSDIHGTKNGYASWRKAEKKRQVLFDKIQKRTSFLLSEVL